MIDDLVSQVGGDYVDHITLISGELDPHSYELVKGDDEKIAEAHLLVSNGLGLEHGASLRYWLEKHPFALSVGDEIQRSFPELILRVDGELDPHVWMDISLWSNAIEPIVQALSKLDPEHASFYRENGAETFKKMQHTHAKIVNLFKGIPAERRFLVTSHDAFNYFTRSYLAEDGEEDWSLRFAAPEGLAPDGQLSSSDIQRIIDHLCEYKIGVVFSESNVSKDSLRKIISACLEKGHPVRISSEVLYGDAMGGQGSHADTYLDMIEHNASVILRDWGYVNE
jgi:manganese/zinc/iron transport system substrate-binding protein